MNLLNAKVVEAQEGLEVGLSPVRRPVPVERRASLAPYRNSAITRRSRHGG